MYGSQTKKRNFFKLYLNPLELECQLQLPYYCTIFVTWGEKGTWRNGQSVALFQCCCMPCGFESRLVQDFQKNIMFFPFQSWDIVSMLFVSNTLHHKCFTLLRWKWASCRTEMTMCTISSMRRNGCRMIGLKIWYQTINLHLYLYLYPLFERITGRHLVTLGFTLELPKWRSWLDLWYQNLLIVSTSRNRTR